MHYAHEYYLSKSMMSCKERRGSGISWHHGLVHKCVTEVPGQGVETTSKFEWRHLWIAPYLELILFSHFQRDIIASSISTTYDCYYLVLDSPEEANNSAFYPALEAADSAECDGHLVRFVITTLFAAWNFSKTKCYFSVSVHKIFRQSTVFFSWKVSSELQPLSSRINWDK